MAKMSHDSATSKASPELPPANGRRKNYWEPIFAAEALPDFSSFDWKTRTVTGIRHQICSAERLKELRQTEQLSAVKTFSFSECDFFGIFDIGPFTFKNCLFDCCDLGRSTWRNIKFQSCRFKRCSLTQATFDSCQFLDCQWEEIGFSGTETHVHDCVITSPSAFVAAGYTNLDAQVLLKHGKTQTHQTMRLEQTKLKIARIVLASLERNGDDAAYYEAIKTYLNQSIEARIAELKHSPIEMRGAAIINRLRLFILNFEKAILLISGSVNDWGASVAKPAVVGILMIFCFAFYYNILGIQNSASSALIASFDITTLVGYTKHASKDGRIFEQLSYMANMALGLWWYAIFVPTVINRISRVRA